jgi:hypothetical protein
LVQHVLILVGRGGVHGVHSWVEVKVLLRLLILEAFGALKPLISWRAEYGTFTVVRVVLALPF